MAELFNTLSIISFAVAGVCLVLAVFLWFFLKIPSVIGDLSGHTARKSIAQLRVANEKSGNKKYKESNVNIARGKLTEPIPATPLVKPVQSSNPIQTVHPGWKLQQNQKGNAEPETEVLAENRAETYQSAETEVLGCCDVLYEEEMTQALISDDETVDNTIKTASLKQLQMLETVMFIHTEEVIL